MGFEELVEQLKGARGVLVRDRERIDDEINRVDAAIRVLDGAPATEVATIAFEHNVDVMVPRTTKGEHKKPTAQRKPGNSPEQARARWAEVFEWVKAAKAANLDLHCRGTHRRPATTAERTPVAAA